MTQKPKIQATEYCIAILCIEQKRVTNDLYVQPRICYQVAKEVSMKLALTFIDLQYMSFERAT